MCNQELSASLTYHASKAVLLSFCHFAILLISYVALVFPLVTSNAHIALLHVFTKKNMIKNFCDGAQESVFKIDLNHKFL